MAENAQPDSPGVRRITQGARFGAQDARCQHAESIARDVETRLLPLLRLSHDEQQTLRSEGGARHADRLPILQLEPGALPRWSRDDEGCSLWLRLVLRRALREFPQVHAVPGAVRILLPRAETVYICSIDTLRIQTLLLRAGEHVRPLTPGVYVVVIGKQPYKILIRDR